MKPEISVIMPVYNAEPFLKEAIDSVLEQTFGDFELIIINDASTDNSERIIHSYSDPRIKYIRNSENLGLIRTLNKAVDLASGQFIARMDNDDISYPHRFELQLRDLKNDGTAAMVCSPIMGITASGQTRDHWPTDINTRTPEAIRNTLPWENCIVHPSVLIRADILRKYRYSSNQKGSEDWDLWLRMSRDGLKIIKTNEVLLSYRVHDSSMTLSHNRRQSPQIKSAVVKARFIAGSLKKGRVNPFVLKTAFTIGKDLAYELKRKQIPFLARQLKRLSTLSPIKAASQYRELRTALNSYQGRHFLFFPYSHLGGAEKVHGQITRAVEDQRPLVFFTGIHNSDDHRELFGEQAELLNIASALYHPFYTKRSRRLLIRKINASRSSVVFGCNNQFFYELLLFLDPGIFVADLTHDIDYTNNPYAESHLPNYLRCNQRIFISRKAMERTLSFYEKNFIEDGHKKKLRLIYNCVDLPPLGKEKKWKPPYTFMYVGRDTAEKRVGILLQVARQAFNAGLPFRFVFVGPVTEPEEGAGENCFFTGVVTDKGKLAELYESAHFIGISSSSEGFPLSVMEGMVSGCIPVCTSVGDIPSHITDGKNGFLVEAEGNVAGAIADLLTRIHQNGPALSVISAEAVKYALLKFDCRQFVSAYRLLLKASGTE